MAEGYLYALDNTSMHGVYKVGCTTRNPFDRARELRTTGVPSEFSVVMAFRVNDILQAELRIHAVLDHHGYRVDRNREFFRVPYRELLRMFAEHLDEPGVASQPGGPAVGALVAGPVSAPKPRPEPKNAEDLCERAAELQHGQGDTPADVVKARRFYELAAAEGHLEACRALISLNADNETKAEFYRTRFRALCTAQLSEEARNYLSEGKYFLAWLTVARKNSVGSLELILETLEEQGVNLTGGSVLISPGHRLLLDTLKEQGYEGFLPSEDKLYYAGNSPGLG